MVTNFIIVIGIFTFSAFGLEFNGSNYKISPKPCVVKTTNGRIVAMDTDTGTCMFVWECIKNNGKHLGMCVDGFMFGSCCRMQDMGDGHVDLVESDGGQGNRTSGHEIGDHGDGTDDGLLLGDHETQWGGTYDGVGANKPEWPATYDSLVGSNDHGSESTSDTFDSMIGNDSKPEWPATYDSMGTNDNKPEGTGTYDSMGANDNKPEGTATYDSMGTNENKLEWPSGTYDIHVGNDNLSNSIGNGSAPATYDNVPSSNENYGPNWSGTYDSLSKPNINGSSAPANYDSLATSNDNKPYLHGTIDSSPTSNYNGSLVTYDNEPQWPAVHDNDPSSSPSVNDPNWPGLPENRPNWPESYTSLATDNGPQWPGTHDKMPSPPPPLFNDTDSMENVQKEPLNPWPTQVVNWTTKPELTTNHPQTTTWSISDQFESTVDQKNVSLTLVSENVRPPVSMETTTVLPEMTFINPLTTTTAKMPEPIRNYMGCGIPQIGPQKRIVGGRMAHLGQFPWQVSVRRTSFFGFSSTHRCGGALINEQWVATAGHCVDDLMTSQIRIRLGEYDFTVNPKENPFIERGVQAKMVHPRYNFFTYENDLALLKLEKKIPLSKHIIPICLPGNDDLLIGENATVTGWGRLSEGGKLPNKLHYVSVPIISNEKCREMFLKSGRMEYIPDIFLCAGYDNGGRDSCQGDSGGPLQVRGSDNRYFLAGIISWGIGCAEPNMPGVCTRISKFTGWILSVVKGH